jgi:hypothetical protein
MILRESCSHGCHLQSWIPAAEVVREYLAEATAESSADFAVLAHVNYAARYWPASQAGHGPVRMHLRDCPGRAVTDVIRRWCHPAMAPSALCLRQ